MNRHKQVMHDPTRRRPWTPLLRSGVVALGALSVAQAGIIDIDFNTDPAASGLYTSVTTEAKPWRSSGGVDNTGYLAITDARDSQNANILFKDMEPGLVVKSFKFSCDLRIGGGDDQPADGFSLNYVDATDPIVSDIESGINPSGSRYAGTDGEASLPEEGTRTGLAIGFDTWQSAAIGGVQDVVGVSVRVGGALITQFPVPLLPDNQYPGGTYNEAPYRNLPPTDANYASSMQTGAQGTNADHAADQPAYGDPAWGDWIVNLGWEKFEAEVTETGKVIIKWKGVELTPAGGLQTQFAPMPGRILFAGRCGGNHEVTHVDNIHLETVAADNIIIGVATGTPTGFSVTVIDSGPAVLDPATVAITLDGGAITPDSSSKTGGTTTFLYDDPANPFVSGSTHTLNVTASDTRGLQVTEDREFTIPDFLTLDPAIAVAGANTPGFVLDVYHIIPPQYVTVDNNVKRAERQLHGDLGDNTSLDQATGGAMTTYIEPGVINYAQDDETADNGIPVDAGNFTTANGFPDALIPGLNIWDGGTYNYQDNLATRITTVLHLTEVGTYELIFNSDDGFRTEAAKNAREQIGSTIVSVADVGKGASDIVRLVYVGTPGYYPMSTVWWEGGGGASLEWAIRTPSSGGQAMLINAPGSVQAFQVATGGTPSAVVYADPIRNSGNPYPPDSQIKIDIANGTSPVNTGTVKLLINDAEVVATVTPTATGATVRYTPNPLFASGSTVKVTVQFAEQGGATYDNSYTFNVASYTVLPGMLATAVGTGSEAGMTWKVHQTSTGRLNFVAEREEQLAGAFGTSVHDATGEVDGKFLIDYVNFEQDGGLDSGGAATVEQGQFQSDNGAPQNVADMRLPGIPAGHNTDNIAAECEAFVQFDTAGFKTMVVNSDDGFHVTAGIKSNLLREKKYVSLGYADYGKGSSDITFNIYVEKAGVYYMRLVWFEGGGGANCEWFTVNQYAGGSGSRALLGGTQPGSLPVFRTRTVAEPTLPALGGEAVSIGLNFASDRAGGQLAAADVAGVWPQANWNNLRGNTNPRGGVLVNEDGNATPVVVSWSANGTWATTGAGEENNCFTGPNKTLMTGYLDSNNDSNDGVILTGIPATEPYDLVVYSQGSVVGRGGAYRVLDANTGAVLADWRQVTTGTCPTEFVQAPANTDPAVWEEGNFILFCGLQAQDIMIQAYDGVNPATSVDLGTPAGGTQRASVQAVQVVFPATCQPPVQGDLEFTSIVKNQDGSITIEWVGGGTLQAAPTVNGPWENVDGATSPFTFAPDGPALFGRLVR
ncbi:MAG: hypothetical protein H7A46_02030 [Verrucomicrobiales bacterium]|nr:hypothetical protein [Verrucomicrobiales bacterium]